MPETLEQTTQVPDWLRERLDAPSAPTPPSPEVPDWLADHLTPQRVTAREWLAKAGDLGHVVKQTYIPEGGTGLSGDAHISLLAENYAKGWSRETKKRFPTIRDEELAEWEPQIRDETYRLGRASRLAEAIDDIP